MLPVRVPPILLARETADDLALRAATAGCFTTEAKTTEAKTTEAKTTEAKTTEAKTTERCRRGLRSG